MTVSKPRSESPQKRSAPKKDIPVKEKPKPKKSRKKFEQHIFLDWCKACGICIAFCPQKVFSRGEDGKPIIENPDKCIGCRFCELHCPDFAISILDVPEFKGRKTNGK